MYTNELRAIFSEPGSILMNQCMMQSSRLYVEDMLDGERKFLIFAHHGDILDSIEETVRDKVT